MLLLKEI